jgi:hypothetical protein
MPVYRIFQNTGFDPKAPRALVLLSDDYFRAIICNTV